MAPYLVPSLLLLLAAAVGVSPAWRPLGKTRPIRLKQGGVVGMVYESDLDGLGPVEVFRGVPYAQAQRFMPPSSPARFEWLEAIKNGPVCPQSLVELEAGMKGGAGGRTGSGGGRLAYLRRLRPFLQLQDEDCLNLNIYVPSRAYLEGLGGNLNVIVFIHGESFSWNSGNPYDGSTLASYGNVIFVTLNYRLGVLGFLNTRNNRTTSNFGLLDQIAALRWLKDNIAAFGGDPESITLMGHHTGAIAVNYLMLSPVADSGLFQRAILMSGTALSGWAQTKSPEKLAFAVSEQTSCPVDKLLACLREKSLEDILALRDLPEDPAPSVDGIVVKIQPKDLMSHNNDVFIKYDLLCGVTESESYHILDNIAISQGLFAEDIKELLNKFFRENFEHWEQAQDRAMKVYALDKSFMNPIEGRDNTLTLLSDARVVAPMVQTAVFHSTPGKVDVQTYFYVFSHRSKHGDHPTASVSVQGEDLAYILGVPLEVGLHHFHEEYSMEEKHLSETIMSLWLNFAKTGNPNRPRRTNYLIKGHADWALEDVDWPAFEPNNQHFYQIQIPPRIGTKYRDNLMHFWNYFLPTWKPLQDEETDLKRRLRFLDMYNPFVPASRTTTTPPPIVEDTSDSIYVPLAAGISISSLVLVILSAIVCAKYRKRLPFFGSSRADSVEFDIDEVLAALEREKNTGARESYQPSRMVTDDSGEEIHITGRGGPPVPYYIPREVIVPRKPKRHGMEVLESRHSKNLSEERNEARVIDDPDYIEARGSLHDENEAEGHNVEMHPEPDTQMNFPGAAEDALDKIRRSNFPKVLPDFPNSGMELEGNSTHEKRVAPTSPSTNRKSYIRPSPPKVHTVISPRTEKNRNAIPNFLELHSSLEGNTKAKKESKNAKEGKKKGKKMNKAKNDNDEGIELECSRNRQGPLRMETFSSNLTTQNSSSVESGIYFAEPVEVEDEGESSSMGNNSINTSVQTNNHTNDVEIGAILPLITYFDSRSNTSDDKSNLTVDDVFGAMPSKLSQARKQFCNELEKVLHRQAPISVPDLSKSSHIADLMRNEASDETNKDETKLLKARGKIPRNRSPRKKDISSRNAEETAEDKLTSQKQNDNTQELNLEINTNSFKSSEDQENGKPSQGNINDSKDIIVNNRNILSSKKTEREETEISEVAGNDSQWIESKGADRKIANAGVSLRDVSESINQIIKTHDLLTENEETENNLVHFQDIQEENLNDRSNDHTARIIQAEENKETKTAEESISSSQNQLNIPEQHRRESLGSNSETLPSSELTEETQLPELEKPTQDNAIKSKHSEENVND